MTLLSARAKRKDRFSAETTFTLIELIIVIAIIAILASLLLPALKTAKDMAKRQFCANQLRQCYLGLVNYADDRDGNLPTTYSPDNLGNNLVANSENYNRNGGYYGNPNNSYLGWYVLIDITKTIPIEVTKCPSMDWTGNSWGGLVSYGYRWDNDECYPGNNMKAFSRPDVSWRPLLHDGLCYRDGPVTPRTTSEYAFWHAGKGVRWAHQVGGNYCSMSGTVQFKRNTLISGYQSWPHDAHKTLYSNSTGIDNLFK